MVGMELFFYLEALSIWKTVKQTYTGNGRKTVPLLKIAENIRKASGNAHS